MTYCISDIHGEYELFLRLLDKIGFSDSDKLFVLGDMIDKGDRSVKLLKCLRDMRNVECIIGNHEYSLIKRLKYYRQSGFSEREILVELQKGFKAGDSVIDCDTVEWINSLPAYIETVDYICVHAGIMLGPSNEPYPLSLTPTEQFVYDRSFKERGVVVNGGKCVLFGHTPTWHLGGKPRILFYPRDEHDGSVDIKDYYKVHLDTGCYETGVLGLICIDTCRPIYVSKPNAWKL